MLSWQSVYKTIRAFSELALAEQQSLLAKLDLFVWELPVLMEKADLFKHAAGTCRGCRY